MKTLLHTPLCRVKSSILRTTLLAALTVAAPLFATNGTAVKDIDPSRGGHGHDGPAPAKLVELVRETTRQYIDVNSTWGTGYHPMFGCVSGPDHGAMGIHYINLDLVGDGDIDVYKPEALIYEPLGDRMRLVGVEYIVDSATWLAYHKAPPMLEGQAFQFVGFPNRYGLASFFELHVWAWRENPNGAFVDWNPQVTCEGR